MYIIYLFTRFAGFHSRKSEWVSMNGNENDGTYTCNANPKLDNETNSCENQFKWDNYQFGGAPLFPTPFALFSSQLLISSPVLPKLQSNDPLPPHLRVPVWGTLWDNFDTSPKCWLVGYSFQILFLILVATIFWSGQNSPFLTTLNQPHITHPQSIMLLL